MRDFTKIILVVVLMMITGPAAAYPYEHSVPADPPAALYTAGDLVTAPSSGTLVFVEGYDPCLDAYGYSPAAPVSGWKGGLQFTHEIVHADRRDQFEREFPLKVDHLSSVPPLPLHKWEYLAFHGQTLMPDHYRHF